MIPGARQVTETRVPALNPALSSQRPMRRIFGLMRRPKKSPSCSIFNVRTEGPDCLFLRQDGLDSNGGPASNRIHTIRRPI
jgi:hypothetical protein